MSSYSWGTEHRRGFARHAHGQMHYFETGSGPNLTLLHQSPSSARMYSDVMKLLARRFRIIAFDTPGFGEFDPLPGQPTVPDYANAFVEALTYLKINGTHLLGHHTGAAFAVEIAASTPLLVDRLVLFGVPDYREPGGRDKRRAAITPGKLVQDPAQLTEIFNRIQERSPTLDPALVTRLVLEQIRAGERSHFGSLAVVEYDVRKRLKAIEATTLVIAGTRDRFWNESPDVVARIPNSWLDVIEDVSSFVCSERPDAFAAAINRFLAFSRLPS